MNEEIERIIEGLKDGSITISKVPNKYRKDPLVQQTYLEIKNNKEIERAIKVIEKDWNLVYCLRNASEEVISSPKVIKAALEHNKYGSYKYIADDFYRKKQKNIELEYDKFVIDNAELYKDVPETIYELIRCGYDIVSDRFFLIERRKERRYHWDKEDTSVHVSFKFVNDDKELNRYHSDRLLFFNKFEELMEVVTIRNYDIYVSSNFDDFKFSNELIIKYGINVDALLKNNLFKNSDFTSFNTFIRKFKQHNKLHFYRKWFDRKYKLYKIEIEGETKSCGEPIAETLEFHTFCEYSRFLKGDLSDADLIFSFELERLKSIDTSWMNFKGSKLTCKIRNSLGIADESYKCESLVQLNDQEADVLPEYNSISNIDTDLFITQNEERRLVEKSYEQVTFDNNNGNTAVFYYFSDLHLADRFNILRSRKECIVPEDEIVIMDDLVNELVEPLHKDLSMRHNGYYPFLLVNGDTSRDFRLFKLFVKTLKARVNCISFPRLNVVFTFGNRELYGFSEKELNEAELLLKDNRMYLLRNEVLVVCEDKGIEIYRADELMALSEKELSSYFETVRIIIIGGTGFKVDSIYYPAAHSDEFEEIYEKIMKLNRPHTVVMTHYPPIKNPTNKISEAYYCEYRQLYPEFIYCHGHTHNNYYFNDGTTMIYADNQLYANERKDIMTPIGLKKFFLENSYDLFETVMDGIHKITVDRYRSYMSGVNIQMQLNRSTGQIYLLKKNGYNCFIEKNKGVFSMLNGGRSKKIEEADSIEYIYERMDKVIEKINGSFLNNFDKKLQYLSVIIKNIGGSGKIHGCIVDIDWFNHIYLNPNDNTVTAYFAENITDKVVYPNIASLLECECKSIYDNMLKLISDNSETSSSELSDYKNIFYLKSGYDRPFKYESREMYSNSYKIKKMQKLNKKILATWINVDYDIDVDKLESDNMGLLEFNEK